MMDKVRVEVAPAQVRKLREPFTVTTRSDEGYETLSFQELCDLQNQIQDAIDKYNGIMNGDRK